MRKFLLLVAALAFTFGAFVASCATQTESDTKAPAASTHKDGSGKSMVSVAHAMPPTHRATASFTG